MDEKQKTVAPSDESVHKVEQMLGVKNLYACVACAEVEDEYLTAASVKFHERQGFKICGKFTDCGFKFERWYSMVWMEKILEAR